MKISYKFNGILYTTVEELIIGLVENWNLGKKELFNGNIKEYFNPNYTEYHLIINHILEEKELTDESDDLLFFKWVYLMNKGLTKIYWKNYSFDDLESCMQNLKTLIDNKADMTNFSIYCDMYINKVFSTYLISTLTDSEKYSKVVEIENKFIFGMTDNDIIDLLLELYFVLASEKVIIIGDKKFSSVEDLVKHLEKLKKGSFSKLEEFCKNIINVDGSINKQVKSWLLSLGYEDLSI